MIKIKLDEYESILLNNQNILNNIDSIILNSYNGRVRLEGNCMSSTNRLKKCEKYKNKQMNLYSLSKDVKNILEIGFNAGHSSLIFLLSNQNSQIYCFDICSWKYTKKCFKYLSKTFPNRLKLIKGSSIITVPKFIKENQNKTFDLVHIDGCHDIKIAKKDFKNCYKITNKGGIIILDDTQNKLLNNLFNYYISKKLIKEVFLYEPIKINHRIGIKI